MMEVVVGLFGIVILILLTIIMVMEFLIILIYSIMLKVKEHIEDGLDFQKVLKHLIVIFVVIVQEATTDKIMMSFHLYKKDIFGLKMIN